MYESVLSAAPASVREDARLALAGTRGRALAQVMARPRSIKKLYASVAETVVDDIDDPVLLADVIAVRDNRIGVQGRIGRHVLRHRASRIARERRGAAMTEPVLAGTPESLALAQVTDADAYEVTAWVMSRPEPDRSAWATAVLRELETLPAGSLVTSRSWMWDLAPVMLQAALARPGAEPSPALTAVPRVLSRAVEELDVIDEAVVRALAVHAAPLPLSSRPAITDAAARAMLQASPDHARTLLSCWTWQGSDEDLLALARTLPAATQEHLLRAYPERVLLIEELAPVLVAGTQSSYSRLVELLDRTPDLSADARVALASAGTSGEIATWLSGAWLNVPRPGEARAAVLALNARHAVELDMLASRLAPLPASSARPGHVEAVGVLWDVCEKNVDRMLSRNGLVAVEGARRLAAGLGEDAGAWATAVRLLPGWEGTLADLISAARCL